MKKIVSLIVVLVMFVTLLLPGAYAARKLIAVEIDDVACELEVGTVVEVPVKVTQNSGIAICNIRVSWDNTSVKMLAPVYNGFLKDAGTKADYESNRGNYLFVLGDEYTEADCTKTGELLTLRFEILKGATAGKTEIELSAKAGDFYDATMKEVEPVLSAGSITLAGTEVPPVDPEPQPPVDPEPAPPVEPEDPSHDNCPSAKFTDVNQDMWYHEGIDYVIDNGLMNGVGDTLFSPNGTTNRAMIVTILYRLEGTPGGEAASFTDVADGQWYSDAVGWAAANGIVTGYENGTFGPLKAITREQLAAILYRYASYKDCDVSASASLQGFGDAGTVSSYAVPSMQWAVGAELINGMDGNLKPKGTATRAQVATILMRFCENVAN